jgi:protein SCO1/2
MKLLFLLLVAASLVFASACHKPVPGGKYPPASATAKHLDFHGKVTGVDTAEGKVSVAHEDVMEADGKTLFMKGMDMPFSVHDDEAFAQLAVGDQISGTLVVDRDAFWLEGLAISKVVATPGTPADDSRAGIPEPGTPMVNALLVNQDGKKVPLDSYRGKVLVLTFLYTRCPLPEYCSLMASNFVAIDKELQKNQDHFDRTHLACVTIDPEGDTPPVLRAYGEPLVRRGDKAEFDHWEFLTGPKEEIRKAGTFFGLDYFPENGQITHSLRTAIITPDGKVFKVYKGNAWRPDQLEADLNRLLDGTDK